MKATSGPSDWLAGLNIDDFDGDTVAAKLVRAAASINAVRQVLETTLPSSGLIIGFYAVRTYYLRVLFPPLATHQL